MRYVSAAESGDGAIVDVSFLDSQLLRGVCRALFDSVGSADFVERTGYTEHAFDYLYVWISEHRPDAAHRHATHSDIGASLTDRLGSPTAGELLLATEIDDSDTSTVRWKFNREALLMFDVAISEIYDGCAGCPPCEDDVVEVTGFEPAELRSFQQQIKDILVAVELTAQQAVPNPAVVRDTSPSLARGDKKYVANKDELVDVEFTADHRWLLVDDLLQWDDSQWATSAMATAVGFDSVDDLLAQYDRRMDLMERTEIASITDWTRARLAAEVCLASDLLGAGFDGDAVAGGDTPTGILRTLQRRRQRARALAQVAYLALQRIETIAKFSGRVEENRAAAAPKEAPPNSIRFFTPEDVPPNKIEPTPWPIESIATQGVSAPWVASVTTPGRYTIAVPAGTTGIVILLIGGGGGGGAYIPNGDLTAITRGSRGESTTAKVLTQVPSIEFSAAGGYGGISTDYTHDTDASFATGQSTYSFSPELFPSGFIIPGGIGGSAGNDSPGGDGGAPGAGGGPGAGPRDRYPYGKCGGSAGLSGERWFGLEWLSDDITESGAVQITGVVGAGGAGDQDSHKGTCAGGHGGCGAAYFAFVDRPAPTGVIPEPEYFDWKLPRIRTWPDVDWTEDAGAEASS